MRVSGVGTIVLVTVMGGEYTEVRLEADTTSTDSSKLRACRSSEPSARLRSLRRFVNLDSELHFGSEYVGELSTGLADAVKGMARTISASWADQFAAPPRGDDARVPVRNASVKCPLAPDGEWLVEKVGPQAAAIAIARVPNSGDVTYEIVNFIDGARTVSDIRDAVSAEFQPIDIRAVAEYFDVLAKAGAITFKR